MRPQDNHVEDAVPRETCEACDGKRLGASFRIIDRTGFEYEMVCCSDCGLLQFSRVLSAGKTDHVAWEGDWWDQPTPAYDENRRSFYLPLLDILSDCGIREGKLLDVGCSFGGLMEAAREKGLSVCGVDISEQVLEYLRTKKSMDAYRTISEAVTCKGLFDVVTCVSTLFYLRHPLRELFAIRAALAPGGTLIVDLQANRGWIVRLWRWLLSIVGKKLVVQHGQVMHNLLNASYYAFNTRNLQRIIERAGFRIVAVRNTRRRRPRVKNFRSLCLAVLAACHDSLSKTASVLTGGRVNPARCLTIVAQRRRESLL